MIRVAVIGCGKIAAIRHLPEYDAHPDVRIVGVFDGMAARTAEVAKKYNAKAYASAEEAFRDPEVDAVSVCSPNRFHAEHSVAALKAGKHVLCEKPMALSPEECDRMVEAARTSGKKLMIAQNQRFAEAHLKARQLILDGAIGKILSFRTSFGSSGPEFWTIDPGKNVWFFRKDLAGLGVLGDLGIHKTDLIFYLTGESVVSVSARLATLDKRDGEGNPISVDDNAFCIYEMTGGIVGTMTASWTRYGLSDDSTVLYGTEGVLRLYDDPEYPVILHRKDRSVERFDAQAIRTARDPSSSGVIDAFIASIEEDRDPPISGAEGAKIMKTIFAAAESYRTGRTVRVE